MARGSHPCREHAKVTPLVCSIFNGSNWFEHFQSKPDLSMYGVSILLKSP